MSWRRLKKGGVCASGRTIGGIKMESKARKPKRRFSFSHPEGSNFFHLADQCDVLWDKMKKIKKHPSLKQQQKNTKILQQLSLFLLFVGSYWFHFERATLDDYSMRQVKDWDEPSRKWGVEKGCSPPTYATTLLAHAHSSSIVRGSSDSVLGMKVKVGRIVHSSTKWNLTT